MDGFGVSSRVRGTFPYAGRSDEVGPLRPFRAGRQCLEVVELIFESANVRTLLPAERSAASRAGPPAMTGRRVDLADQLHQAGISIVCIQETRCRGQVTGSCRGFGVFAAAPDKAGRGGVELWIRQDIMGDPRSFHVLVAELRFLLVNGHTAAGVRHRSRMGGRSSRSFQSKSSRAFGPDAIPSELIAVGGQGYRRALDVLCAKVLKEGAPMLWKGGDVVAVPRKPGPLTPKQHERSFVLQLSRKDVCERAACSRGALATIISWYVADGSCPGRRYGICLHDAQPFQFLGSVGKAFFSPPSLSTRPPKPKSTNMHWYHPSLVFCVNFVEFYSDKILMYFPGERFVVLPNLFVFFCSFGEGRFRLLFTGFLCC